MSYMSVLHCDKLSTLVISGHYGNFEKMRLTLVIAWIVEPNLITCCAMKLGIVHENSREEFAHENSREEFKILESSSVGSLFCLELGGSVFCICNIFSISFVALRVNVIL